MAKRIPKKIIKEIRILRSRGYSLPELKNKFKIGHGTVWRHIQNINILPEFKQIWEEKKKSSVKRKKIAENIAENKAKKLIVNLSPKEKALILSCLYWGEGNKRDFSFTNTDPNIIKVFVDGLIDTLGISKDRIRMNIRIYEDLNRENCIKFWLETTSLPKESFSSFNILKGKKRGKLEYGMCRIRVLKGGNMLKYLKAINKQIITNFCSRSSTDRTEVS